MHWGSKLKCSFGTYLLLQVCDGFLAELEEADESSSSCVYDKDDDNNDNNDSMVTQIRCFRVAYMGPKMQKIFFPWEPL